MHYTLKQASEATGKDRSTLLRAIKCGKLSAIRQDDKSYLIDAAELSRVYHLHERISVNAEDLPKYAQPDAQVLDAFLADLEAKREREIQRLEETITDLRAERDRLLRVIEGQSETVKQLTFQRHDHPMPEPIRIKPWWSVRAWLWVLLAAVALAAAVVKWLV
jgi:hypothetical protein